MHPALVVALLGLPFVAFAGWYRLVRDGSDSVVGSLVAGFFTVAQFSGVLALLGWAGLLSPGTAISVQLAMTAIIWVSAGRRGSPAANTKAAPPWSGQRLILLSIGLIAGLVLLRTGFYASLLPVDGSDGSSYHLPPLIEALNAGSYSPSDSVVEIGRAGPKTVEMVFLWLMLGRTLDLVLWGQILFLPLGVIATAAIARWAGVGERLAWASGVLIVFIPVVIAQLTTAYVDVGAGVLLLIAIALTLLYRQDRLPNRWGAIAVYGSLGFVAGAKYSLLIPALLLGLMALASDVARRRFAWEHAVGVVLAVVGAGWYITTWVNYGNPFWPYGISALDALFPNYLETVGDIVQRELDYVPRLAELPPWSRPLLVWGEPGTSPFMYSFDSRLAGLGPLWVIAFIPAIVTWVMLSWHRRSAGKVLLLVSLFFTFWILGTYPWWTRFNWWLAALGAVALARVWEMARPGIRTAMGVVVLLGAGYVLALTSVQGFWEGDVVVALARGTDPVELDAGPVVASAYHRADEVIAVPGLAWGSWNTYLRGDTFDNAVVVVPATSAQHLEQGLSASGATMAFVPGGGLAWSDAVLDGSAHCLEEVISDDERGQALFRVSCS